MEGFSNIMPFDPIERNALVYILFFFVFSFACVDDIFDKFEPEVKP